MSNAGDYRKFPMSYNPPGASTGNTLSQFSEVSSDPTVPLLNLSTVQARMDSLQRFLSGSVNGNTLIGKDRMDMVSAEIASAIHQIIVNGAALLACSQNPSSLEIAPNPNQIIGPKSSDSTTLMVNPRAGSIVLESEMKMMGLKVELIEDEINDDYEIVELDSVELLAEHSHFCDICGKGFKRDANLRMHMRAHGNQFKTPEALAKPEKCGSDMTRRTRFSCPYMGCNRNKSHNKFRPLKSAICVKNHFKRSHCPKMYSCNRCNKKSFSVLADLKSHLKHCGETKWKCSCGTSFSRKDKLFGHVALFQGHMPAVEEEKQKGVVVMVEDEEEEEDPMMNGMELDSDNGFFEGLLEGFGSIEDYCLQDVLGSPNSNGMDGIFNFDMKQV
ncbi:unnamed protein product [Ilex paraguariensis]|uniref:C2H2-type domain-containing protein n=1 Tax=Ilex paraguariensis TaxID=185542 RepID=A0ABC8SZ16_9AQUA